MGRSTCVAHQFNAEFNTRASVEASARVEALRPSVRTVRPVRSPASRAKKRGASLAVMDSEKTDLEILITCICEFCFYYISLIWRY